jgi:hypothetical protein
MAIFSGIGGKMMLADRKEGSLWFVCFVSECEINKFF